LALSTRDNVAVITKTRLHLGESPKFLKYMQVKDGTENECKQLSTVIHENIFYALCKL